MLQQPMINKMLAMRLHGMAEALKAQEQDTNVRDLSFLERLGLLIDQQWNWRENQALARRLKNAKLRGNPCVEDIDFRAARGLDKSVMRTLTQESTWVRNHENVFVLGPTGVGKSLSPRRWRKKLAATATPPSTRVPPPCSASLPSLAPTEASAICLLGSAVSTC